MNNVEWDRVKGRLRDEVGDAAYRSWVRPITLQDVRDGSVRLCLPTRFMRDWVATHYSERIRALWGAENPSIRTVEVVVASRDDVVSLPPAPVPNPPAGGGRSGSRPCSSSSRRSSFLRFSGRRSPGRRPLRPGRGGRSGRPIGCPLHI